MKRQWGDVRNCDLWNGVIVKLWKCERLYTTENWDMLNTPSTPNKGWSLWLAYHMSHVTYHISHIACHILHITYWISQIAQQTPHNVHQHIVHHTLHNSHWTPCTEQHSTQDIWHTQEPHESRFITVHHCSLLLTVHYPSCHENNSMSYLQ